MTLGTDQPARPPGRGNGLPAQRWIAVADLDPRVADDLLIAMHAAGIAARTEPTPAAVGGYMEVRLPDRPVDRLFADADAETRARELVAAELAETPETTETLLPPSGWRPQLSGEGTLTGDPAQEDHYQPPAAPPLPRLRPATVGSLAAIALGIVILVVGFDGGAFGVLGVVAIIGGIASLVWHMNDGPPKDSGWDDGAVL